MGCDKIFFDIKFPFIKIVLSGISLLLKLLKKDDFSVKNKNGKKNQRIKKINKFYHG
jgi:hypothetical protein